MPNFLSDFATLNRLLELFIMLGIGFFAFRKRPWIVACVVFLNTLPDFVPIPPQDRIRLEGTVPTTIEQASSSRLPLSRENILKGDHSGVLLNTIQTGVDWFERGKNSDATSESEASSTSKARAQFVFVCRASYLLAALLIFTKTPVLSVAGFCLFLIPFPYYLQRFFEFMDLFTTWQLERQMWIMGSNPDSFFTGIISNPSGQLMLLICAILLSGVFLGIFFFTQKEARTFNLWIPDPQKYWALMEGKRHEFRVTDKFIIVRDIQFRLQSAYYDKQEPLKMKFSTGTCIDFIKKPEPE